MVNRPEYIPRNPTVENLPNVFDIRFPEVHDTDVAKLLYHCIYFLFGLMHGKAQYVNDRPSLNFSSAVS